MEVFWERSIAEGYGVLEEAANALSGQTVSILCIMIWAVPLLPAQGLRAKVYLLDSSEGHGRQWDKRELGDHGRPGPRC